MKKTHSQNTPNLKLQTKRVPAGLKQDCMEVTNKDPNKSYRYINDVKNGSRLQKFRNGGYDFDDRGGAEVTGNQSEHEKHTKESHLDVGHGTKAYLMSIPKHLYDEDQLEKAKRQDKKMDVINNRAMAEGASDNEYTTYNVTENKIKVDKHYGKSKRP